VECLSPLAGCRRSGEQAASWLMNTFLFYLAVVTLLFWVAFGVELVIGSRSIKVSEGRSIFEAITDT